MTWMQGYAITFILIPFIHHWFYGQKLNISNRLSTAVKFLTDLLFARHTIASQVKNCVDALKGDTHCWIVSQVTLQWRGICIIVRSDCDALI